MAKETQTKYPSFAEIHANLTQDPDYYNNHPLTEKEKTKSNSRLRKWGRRAVATVILGGALFAGAEGVGALGEAQDAKEHTMVQELDKAFGDKLSPVAQSIAKDVYEHAKKVDGHRGEKGFENKHAAIIDDPGDSSKLVLDYSVDVEGGSYSAHATVAKKENGEPDLGTVYEAGISERAVEETPDRPLLRADIEITHGNNSTYSESKFQYWGASVTSENPGGKTPEDKSGTDGYNSFYDYEDNYDDKEVKLEQAEDIAGQVPHALERLDNELPIS